MQRYAIKGDNNIYVSDNGGFLCYYDVQQYLDQIPNPIIDCRSCSKFTGKFCSDVIKCVMGERFIQASPIQIFKDAIYNQV